MSCLFALFTRGYWWGPNCGERYWGDFYSDPPDCHDPCDCYGNYAGCGGTMPGEVYEDAAPAPAPSYHAPGGCKNCGRTSYPSRPIPQSGNARPMDYRKAPMANQRAVAHSLKSATPQPHSTAR